MKTKLLIFGITGDLSRRKLLPALEEIVATGRFKNLEIIGVSRREVDMEALLKAATGRQMLAKSLQLFTMDMSRAEEYERLKERLDLQEGEQLLVYLSVPPAASTRIVDFLGEAGVNTPNVKVLFEKPFGVDLASAKDMIKRTERYFAEDQVYRIDHYLAKEMAQNIVVFRGSNAIFSHLWSGQTVEKVEVIASESIDIEGRADFYEQTGALRDFVQGHLMQLLALVLMDVPHDFDWTKLPALRLEVLKALRPADPAKALRAQYEGYQGEVGNIGSQTETFVRVELESTDKRWRGVPLVLTTGKALDSKVSEVRIHFKKLHEAQSNCLVFRIQPHEGIEIDLFVKKPSYDRELKERRLSYLYPHDEDLPEAYEQVLVDAIESRKSLFATSDEIVRSWELLQPLQYAWSMDSTPLHFYTKGSDSKAITDSVE